MNLRWVGGMAMVMATPVVGMAADDSIREDAAAALRRAVGFYEGEVSHEGAYVYAYSADLRLQEGEGKALRTTGWTEPPGTPAVGAAYLAAWRLTGEDYLMEAARRTAGALIEGQLRSGGWDSRFELGPEQRKNIAYRTNAQGVGRRNVTTLDDDKSQSALMFLIRLDEALEFKDGRLHEAIEYAFEHFLAAQYPNGAWPQRFEGPPDPLRHPVLKASYPDTWSRVYEGIDYKGYYTFNDGAMEDMVDVLLEAHRIYGDEKFMKSALRTGDFMLLAQMPEPQPGWAQQYDAQMHPAWARKFEPASISGGESQGVMLALMRLYAATGEKRFLEPIPRALAYYRKVVLPGGKIPRFIELKTDKPLYFTLDYKLTYSDADMPTHYGFIQSHRLDNIEREYAKRVEGGPRALRPVSDVRLPTMSSSLAKRARTAIDAMDGRGAWVEKGEMKNYDAGDGGVIFSRTFIENVSILAQAAAAK